MNAIPSMSRNESLNVYFYALYDANDQQAHSGLTANICEAAVREDIEGNYSAPRYVTVKRVPELVGIDNGYEMSIIKRPHGVAISQLNCSTCRFYPDCLPRKICMPMVCVDWEARA